MDEIQEMIEVCCCAQNMYDEEASRNAALIKEYEESEKDYQEQKEQLKKDVESLSSDIGNVRKEFEKAQNSIPGFAELAGIVLIYQNQGFIEPFRPPNSKVPTQSRIKTTLQIFVCSRGVENDKGPGRWERKWVKNQFSIEIF